MQGYDEAHRGRPGLADLPSDSRVQVITTLGVQPVVARQDTGKLVACSLRQIPNGVAHGYSKRVAANLSFVGGQP